jgi:hypothetical protein
MLLTAAAWWMLSCREVSSPSGGIFAASPLMLPSPGVVAGDTMRDSLGLVAPLRVIAFNMAGDTVQGVTPTFVIIDTGAHLVGPLLVGDSVGRTVHVLGTVGDVQTRAEAVKVTLSPDTLMAADSLVFHKTYSLTSGDSVVNSDSLRVFVKHVAAALTGVEAVIVRYTIDRAPSGDASKGPTVVLVNNNNGVSTSDTTDVNGKAGIRARLRLAPLTSFEPETVLVSATSSHRGRVLGAVQFIVVFTSQ